jgi:hypothetical protein
VTRTAPSRKDYRGKTIVSPKRRHVAISGITSGNCPRHFSVRCAVHPRLPGTRNRARELPGTGSGTRTREPLRNWPRDRSGTRTRDRSGTGPGTRSGTGPGTAPELARERAPELAREPLGNWPGNRSGTRTRNRPGTRPRNRLTGCRLACTASAIRRAVWRRCDVALRRVVWRRCEVSSGVHPRVPSDVSFGATVRCRLACTRVPSDVPFGGTARCRLACRWAALRGVVWPVVWRHCDVALRHVVWRHCDVSSGVHRACHLTCRQRRSLGQVPGASSGTVPGAVPWGSSRAVPERSRGQFRSGSRASSGAVPGYAFRSQFRAVRGHGSGASSGGAIQFPGPVSRAFRDLPKPYQLTARRYRRRFDRHADARHAGAECLHAVKLA